MCEQDSCGVRDKLSNSDEVTLPDDLLLSDSDPEEEPASVPFDPEVIDLSDSDDEDDDGLQICSAQERPPCAPGQRAVPGVTFSLKGGSSGFSNRSRNIFDCLDSAAKLTSSQLGQDNIIDGVFARPPPPPPLSGNKRPGERAGPPPQGSRGAGVGGQAGRRRGVPDYLVHPERWTCYSLEDVAETSDRQNSLVAQEYLHSLQQRKERATSGPEVESFVPAFNQGQTNRSGSQHKIIFSRPSRAERDPAAAEMKAAGGIERGKGLSHLEEEEDDDDDDDDEKEEEEDEEEEEDGMRLEAMDKGIGRSTEMKKAEGREGGVSHIEQEDEEEEEEDVQPPKEEQRKRKWGQRGRGEVVGDEEEEEEEEKESDKRQANAGFVSFRRPNRKNYRRTSEREED